MTNELMRRYIVVGSRRPSNYIWALFIGLGGFGFLLTGISSQQQHNLLPFIHAEAITFFPQGLVMSFYGLLALLFSFYLSLTILWNVGGGFNLFDKQQGLVRIFRWGFPGTNRRIDLTYALDDISAVGLELKEGLSPKRTIYLCLKGQRQIPLTRIGKPMSLEQIETLGSEFAQFLGKPLLNEI